MSWRKQTKWAAEVSVLITSASFLASVGLNSVIFAGWGLNYLQIASPSDVLMGGIAIAGHLSFPVVAFLVARAALAKSGPRMAVLVSILTVPLAMVPLVLLRMPGPLAESWAQVLRWPLSGVSSGVIVAATLRGFSFYRTLGRIVPIAGAAVIGPLMVVIGWLAFLTLVDNGFWGRGSRAVADLDGCARPIVLWTGSDAVVYRCRAFHVVGRAGQAFIYVPRPKLLRPPRLL